MASSILGQLRQGWEESGLTQGELILLSRLNIKQASLSRKLSGVIAMTISEAEALATALRCEIRFAPKAKGSKR